MKRSFAGKSINFNSFHFIYYDSAPWYKIKNICTRY